MYKKHGFTLLEVLIALTIVAIVLTTMVTTSAKITSDTHYLRQKVFAQWVAMNRMAELRIAKEWPSTGTDTDEVEMANHEWEWTQKVIETEVPDVRRVEISVKALDDESNDEYALAKVVGFLLNPRFISNLPQIPPSLLPHQNTQTPSRTNPPSRRPPPTNRPPPNREPPPPSRRPKPPPRDTR